MNFNKIQPQQLQMPTFFSNSGDLAFTDLTTGFKVELSRFLTGDFNISGDLTINSRNIPQMSPSIVFDRDSGMLIGGTNSTISGEGNFVVNGDGNSIGGEDNTILFSKDSSFEPFSSSNVLIGGNTVTFPSGVTGSMMLGDNNAIRTIGESNTLYVEFNSGMQVNCDTYFTGNVTISGDSVVTPSTLTGVSGDGMFLQEDGVTNTGQTGDLLINIGDKQLRVTGVIYGSGS